MASTYGSVQGSRGKATRVGGKHGVTAKAQTWQTFVTVHVDPDGATLIEIRRGDGLLYVAVNEEVGPTGAPASPGQSAFGVRVWGNTTPDVLVGPGWSAREVRVHGGPTPIARGSDA